MKKLQQKLVPTEIGMVVTDLLVKNFPYIFETGYTAQARKRVGQRGGRHGEVDRSSEGLLRALEEELKVAQTEMEDIKAMEEKTDEICEKCGSAAGAEVGQVRQLLLVLELLERQARHRRAGPAGRRTPRPR